MKNTTPVATSSLSTNADNDIQHCIADLNEDICHLLEKVVHKKVSAKMTTELTVKLAHEDWVVAKKVNQRQLYLAFKNKASHSLLDISDEVDRIMATEFKNICLPP